MDISEWTKFTKLEKLSLLKVAKNIPVVWPLCSPDDLVLLVTEYTKKVRLTSYHLYTKQDLINAVYIDLATLPKSTALDYNLLKKIIGRHNFKKYKNKHATYQRKNHDLEVILSMHHTQLHEPEPEPLFELIRDVFIEQGIDTHIQAFRSPV